MGKEIKIKGYFTVQEKMLKMCGLSLNENQSTFYRFYSALVNVLLFIYIFILTHDIIVNLDDFDVVVNSIDHGLGIILTLCKFWIFAWNRTKLMKTLSLLQQGVFAPNKERGGNMEETWMAECVKNSNLLMGAGCILSLTTISLRVTTTMAQRIINPNSEQLQLPFAKYTIFNPYRSPNYELAWLFQTVVWSMVSMVYVVTDYFIMSVFAHICVQFKMLRNSINRIVLNKYDGTYQNVEGTSSEERSLQQLQPVETTWLYLGQKLKESVLYHRAIMDLAQQLEDILNVYVLTDYVGHTIILACIMYHGSLYPLSDTRFQRDLTVGMVVLFQLFLITYFGNEVTLESQLVLPACYEAKFFDVDVRLQKGLAMIMARSQTPTKFTIGKFADLSLTAFVALGRVSFSYYMVLHNMNQ